MVANCLNEHNKIVDGARKGLITHGPIDSQEHTMNNPIWTSRIASRITPSSWSAFVAAFALAKAPIDWRGSPQSMALR
jgi:hypothetical protein